MTEHRQLEQLLAAECRTAGAWFWINTGPAVRQSGSGWVDAVVLGRKGALFVELKSRDGRRTRAQLTVARMLVALGFEYRLWRRQHFDDGTVTRDIKELGAL